MRTEHAALVGRRAVLKFKESGGKEDLLGSGVARGTQAQSKKEE
ncbi:MAG: hypothetical protein AAFQ78_01265 [Bacteroidota bacterium]